MGLAFGEKPENLGFGLETGQRPRGDETDRYPDPGTSPRQAVAKKPAGLAHATPRERVVNILLVRGGE